MYSLPKKPSSIETLRRKNATYARLHWNPSIACSRSLGALTSTHKLSLEAGDLTLVSGGWYVTHSGLLKLAVRRHCEGIRVEPVKEFCDARANRWVFEAVVYNRKGRAFYGFGDADPSNVSSLVHGAEMRVAETRAVNRALRKAYGVGLCSVEEIGSGSSVDFSPVPPVKAFAPSHEKIVAINVRGKVLLRDQLNQLIREHKLDTELVKRYAADFCGTGKLRDASRELIEDFIRTVGDEALNDRQGLLQRLNSYAKDQESATEEVRS